MGKVSISADLTVKAVVFGKHVQQSPLSSLIDVQNGNSTSWCSNCSFGSGGMSPKALKGLLLC